MAIASYVILGILTGLTIISIGLIAYAQERDGGWYYNDSVRKYAVNLFIISILGVFAFGVAWVIADRNVESTAHEETTYEIAGSVYRDGDYYIYEHLDENGVFASGSAPVDKSKVSRHKIVDQQTVKIVKTTKVIKAESRILRLILYRETKESFSYYFTLKDE